MSAFFHVHAHSRYSVLDGTAPVQGMVDLAVAHGQPGLALTDHGNMSGSIELYRACKAAGIAAFPGIEAYIVRTLDKEEPRFHTGLLALNYEGYRALVKLSTMSFLPDGHFYRKPRISLDELLAFGQAHGDNIVLTTGCYFSLFVQTFLNEGRSAAAALLSDLAFSFPHLYVELQMHNTQHGNGITDWNLSSDLYEIANHCGVPVIIGQDSHYCDAKDKTAHEMMKRLGYHTSDENEILFPGNSYHLSTTGWIETRYAGLRNAWNDAMTSFADLIALNRMSMPAIDNYSFNVPVQSKHPDADLRRAVSRALAAAGLNSPRYKKRMEYELGTIRTMGFADYFLLMKKVVDIARRLGIIINTRGSANGSLICFVLNISQVDPLVWGISFDRFLHPSRKKPPDIDIDVERDRRQELLDAIALEFDVVQIGTFMRMTDVEDRGAIFAKYLAYKRRVLGDGFKSSPFAQIENLSELNQLAPEDVPALRRLANMEVCSGAGTHAAGLILTSSAHPLTDYIPTMLVGGQKGNLVTQMGMDDTEAAGYVKMDLLGLAALTTVAECLRLLGRDPLDGLTWIPLTDSASCALLRTGDTGTGIFQFEGYSTARGGRTMKVRTIHDAILCLALFRPASMDSGNTDQYLQRRKSKTFDSLHPIFDKATADTFGVFVLQDQVIDVLRGLGMRMEDLNDMLKAVKASNTLITAAQATFARLEAQFKLLCSAVGMTPAQTAIGWSRIMGFSDYGFNKAHATAYGLLSYRMAYLKAHHPVDFMCALLTTWAGTKKEPEYVAEARRVGLRIRKTNINHSGANWSTDGAALFRGLLSVKGCGESMAMKIVAEREAGAFTSKDDVLARLGKGVFNRMDEAGAMGDLG
jgi:DNA polymerase-3 subunit alpha